ncbi:DUF3576 domain-containing protein [Pelagibacterales bacterium SAG-MED49]|nr:DUF3576 domain-containing protein [Pelagibacterales bacterium SAG-MED49]
MSKFLSLILVFIFLALGGCGIYKKVDARKVSPNVNDRVKENLEKGKGYKIFDARRNIMGGGAFQFANSNGLWRASLDVIDFMPLTSVNYSGGIIITDWYSDSKNPNESIKISIRFLTNEIRSDSLDIKIFSRKCDNNSFNCKFTNSSENLVAELNKEILKKAAIYKNEEENKK